MPESQAAPQDALNAAFDPLDEAIFILNSIRSTLLNTVEETRHSWVRAGSAVWANPDDSLRLADVNRVDELRKDVLLSTAKLAGFDLAIKALKNVSRSLTDLC